MKMLKTNFVQGLVWNYISILFLAIGGIVFSFLIGFYYDAETLGNFNLVYAYYIVFSQVGVWGTHMAVTRYISEYQENKEAVNAILSGAIFVVCVVAIILDSGVWLLCRYLFREFLSDALLNSIKSVILAVFFFAINKVVLGYLNGLSKMKEYAVFQTMRNILIAIWIIIFALCKVPGNRISFCFAYTEILILLLEIPLIIFKNQFVFSLSFEWVKKIVIFGTHIMPANIVLELSTKVDILCLSWIIKDEKTIGVYSFAALIAEGFYQLFVVLRRSINPYITQSYTRDELGHYYLEIVGKIRKGGYLLGAVCLIAVVLGYRVLCFLMNDTSYYAGTLSLIIITAAIICNMKSIIFGNILSQTGHPAAESMNNIATVLSNFILNILFIHKWGMLGAALATGASYFVFSVNQRIMIKKKLNL